MNITKIIIKKLKGNLFGKEEKFFKDWIHACDENKQLFSRLESMKSKGIQLEDGINLNPERAWINVVKKIHIEKEERKRKPFY